MTGKPFMSKVILRFGRGAGEGLRGATRPYVVHQLIADLFGDFTTRPFLFRSESSGSASEEVLVLSGFLPRPPEEVPERPVGIIESVDCKPFALGVPSATVLDYEIRVNATKDIPREGRRSRRTDVWEAVWREDRNTARTPHEVYHEYLTRKLAPSAEVFSARVTARGFVKARRNLRRPAITFTASNLIGSLKVADSERLLQTMLRGIGRSKAFGCGLLCLSRPGTVLPRRHPEIARALY